MDPRRWVERFVACEHSLLGQKVVDGILCEGIRTTDPGLAGEGAEQLQIESLTATLWVDVQTAYPVLLEGEFDGIVDVEASRDVLR